VHNMGLRKSSLLALWSYLTALPADSRKHADCLSPRPKQVKKCSLNYEAGKPRRCTLASINANYADIGTGT
jgi:hypothetical protein